MIIKVAIAAIALVASCHGQIPADDFPKILGIRLVPSEDVPTTGTCKNDTGGFLEVGGTQLPNNMDDAELGRTIKRTIKDGYTVTLTPQVSNRVFASLECNARHPLIGALPGLPPFDCDGCVPPPAGPALVLQGLSHQRPRIESRFVDVAGRPFQVEYAIDTNMVTVPAVYGGQNNLHYSAMITVYEMGNLTKWQVGKPFAGTYVDGGCFEDDPKEMVARALHPAAN